MAYLLYGAGGMLLVLGLLVLGAVIGWKGHISWQKHTERAVVQEATEEEKRQLEAEQKAFNGLMNYNAEMAYGIGRGEDH